MMGKQLRSRLLAACVFSVGLAACGDDGGGGNDSPDAGAVIDADCSICAENTTCDDSGAVAVCACPEGFAGDGTVAGSGCSDIDECATDGEFCVAEASCTNIDGGFSCECPAGFTGDGATGGAGCLDIDECALETDTCGNADCINVAGSFSCQNVIFTSPGNNLLHIINSAPYLLGQLDDEASATPCDGPAIAAAIELTVVGNIVTGVNGITVDPATGIHYLVYKIDGEANRFLGTVNPLTGVMTEIGPLGDQVASIVFDNNGLLLGTIGNGGIVSESLVSIDPATAETTLLLSLEEGGDGTIIAFDPIADQLFHLGGTSGFPGTNQIDIAIDDTDPNNVIVAASKTAVTREGFAFAEPMGTLFGWPTPGALGLSDGSSDLSSFTFDASGPTISSTAFTLDGGNLSLAVCEPGVSNDTSLVRAMAFVTITPQLVGGSCESNLECATGTVCDLLDSNLCEPVDTCGNGTLEGAEACDDGNVDNGDGCEMDCTITP